VLFGGYDLDVLAGGMIPTSIPHIESEAAIFVGSSESGVYPLNVAVPFRRGLSTKGMW
jgi:hypothetical protein